MAIEFREFNKLRLDILDHHILIGYIFHTSQGIWFECKNEDDEFSIDHLEQILSKMKELQRDK